MGTKRKKKIEDRRKSVGEGGGCGLGKGKRKNEIKGKGSERQQSLLQFILLNVSDAAGCRQRRHRPTGVLL